MPQLRLVIPNRLVLPHLPHWVLGFLVAHAVPSPIAREGVDEGLEGRAREHHVRVAGPVDGNVDGNGQASLLVSSLGVLDLGEHPCLAGRAVGKSGHQVDDVRHGIRGGAG